MIPLVDVVVMGAGPHGLAAALTLARAGLDVRVVDTGSRLRLPWTGVHHWSVLPGLEELGVLAEALELGSASTTWGLRVLATGEVLDYDLAELRGLVRHPFNLRLEEDELCRVLAGHLLASAGVRPCPGRLRTLRQHPGGVTLELDGADGSELVRARFVVAADGATSATRREAGVAFAGSHEGECSVTAMVDHDFAAHGYADTTLQVDGTHGAVVERVEGSRWRYVFQEQASAPVEEVPTRVDQVLRAVTGRRPRVLDWTSERAHQRLASTYRRVSVLLVDEAAHVTHRLIGHSSIAGWYDVFTLGEVLVEVLAGRSDPQALDDWAAERRRVYLDEAVPGSVSRKHLVAQIQDADRLALELTDFRLALGDVAVRREVLLRGRELAGRGAFRAAEPHLLPAVPAP